MGAESLSAPVIAPDTLKDLKYVIYIYITHTHIHTHIYVCTHIYTCVYIYICVYKINLKDSFILTHSLNLTLYVIKLKQYILGE